MGLHEHPDALGCQERDEQDRVRFETSTETRTEMTVSALELARVQWENSFNLWASVSESADQACATTRAVINLIEEMQAQRATPHAT